MNDKLRAAQKIAESLLADVDGWGGSDLSIPANEVGLVARALLDLSAVDVRLDFALAVIDDHDEEHPEARLRPDYEQRVEEDESEARGQAMDP